MLDMNSGLGAGIAVLERFAGLAEQSENLILMATP
jgi:arginine utilization protein RocB